MRQLLAVQRFGSFAKAAKALGLSQPSLSNAIARLEDQLKVRLFERTPGGSHLTAIGELIAERARKVVAESEQIIRDAELVAGGEAGEIRLGVGTALRKAFLPKLLLRVAEAYPLLTLQVEVLDRDRLLPLLRCRELDLVICSLGSDIAPEEIVAAEIITTEGVAVAHPDHPLAREAPIPIERFAEFPAAGAAQTGFTNARLLELGDRRISRYRSNDYEPLLELALAGRATLLAPKFVVKPYIASGQLKRLDLDWNYRVSFAALATRATSYSPMVSRIVAHAVAVGAELSD